jgi:hypothetical protein
MKTAAILEDIPEEFFSYRRSSERYSCCIEGVFTYKGNAIHTIKCSDISLYGLGGVTVLPLPPNTFVKIKAACQHYPYLLLQGRVCWCKRDLNGYRVGIEFYRPLPYVLARIIQ